MKTFTFALFALLMASPAHALEQAVKMACTGDYFEHCSHTFPGSAACEACFRDVGPGLSRTCLNAIRQSSAYAGEYQTRRRRYVQH